jgi:signal peptidase I
MLLVVLVAALLIYLVWTVRWRYLVVTVRGSSMYPALEPGDRVLVDRTGGARPTSGDVVALRLPPDARGDGGDHGPARCVGGTLLVKRLAAVEGEGIPDVVPAPAGGRRVVPPGKVVLLGDAPYSLDSRAWGCVPEEWIVGVVVRRLRRQMASRGRADA